MIPRSCIDCGVPSIRTRCGDCERARQKKRNASRPQYRGRWRALSAAVVAAQPWCSVCGHDGSEDNPLTAGHVVAVANGGTNERSNLRTECRRCNSRRGHRR